MGKVIERRQRGAKPEEHLEVLRTSNPCYGSLLPLNGVRERVGKHELPYDPTRRYAILRSMINRAPRGAKSDVHLEVLRQGNPCYGSLRPTERVQTHARCAGHGGRRVGGGRRRAAARLASPLLRPSHRKRRRASQDGGRHR